MSAAADIMGRVDGEESAMPDNQAWPVAVLGRACASTGAVLGEVRRFLGWRPMLADHLTG